MALEPQQKFGGPVPKFNEYHLWKAIVSLDDKSPIGRKKLSTILGIGEGSTRTIISILTKKQYVTTRSNGIQLTEIGKKFKDQIHIDTNPIVVSDLTIGPYNCAARVPHASKRITCGCEERDTAIKCGATGATTLVCINDNIIFPDSRSRISTEAEIKLRSLFKIQDGDVIIIGTADSPSAAERGAIIAALGIVDSSKTGSTNGVFFSVNIADVLSSVTFTIHNLVGRLPVCAKMKNKLGVRIENGVVIDSAYTGEILEQAIKTGKTIKTTAHSGPYKDEKVIASPIEINGSTIAAIGIVEVQKNIDEMNMHALNNVLRIIERPSGL